MPRPAALIGAANDFAPRGASIHGQPLFMTIVMVVIAVFAMTALAVQSIRRSRRQDDAKWYLLRSGSSGELTSGGDCLPTSRNARMASPTRLGKPPLPLAPLSHIKRSQLERVLATHGRQM